MTTISPFSPLIAGCWRMSEWGWSPQARLAWIEACIERGVSSFDHADIYGGYVVEALFGEALALKPGLRREMQLISKCGIKLVHPARPEHRVHGYDCSRKHIVQSVERSLRALHTEHLDLLLLHRPDALLDAEEVAEAFAALKAAGKVLSFGVSNYSAAQFDLLNAFTPLASNQVELNPLNLSVLHDGTLDQAQRLKRPPMIWSPLAGGRLFSDSGAQAQRVREVLQAAADARGVSLATAAYAWVLRHPSRPLPIIGSQRLAALDEALNALSWQMDAETWWSVWRASTGHDVP